MYERMGASTDYVFQKQNISDLDLKEYEDSFRHAKKMCIKTFYGRILYWLL